MPLISYTLYTHCQIINGTASHREVTLPVCNTGVSSTELLTIGTWCTLHLLHFFLMLQRSVRLWLQR